MPTLHDVLDERGNNYGDFSDNALVAQELKAGVRRGISWHIMPPYMKEGIDMILSKISRAVTGDCYHLDTYTDICGYSRLIEERVEEYALGKAQP